MLRLSQQVLLLHRLDVPRLVSIQTGQVGVPRRRVLLYDHWRLGFRALLVATFVASIGSSFRLVVHGRLTLSISQSLVVYSPG